MRTGKWLCFLAMLGALTHPLQAQPVLLTTEHIDVALVYEPDAEGSPLGLEIDTEDHGASYSHEEVILVVNESAEFEIPFDTPFGQAGESIWILPQSPQPDLLFIGFSAEELPEGLFEGPVDLLLKGVEGPGNFFIWQTTDSGGFDVRMNSQDGISDDDKISPMLGGHEHANWGFSTAGVYTITFQVSGRRAGESTNIVSDLLPFTFHVLPLPDEPGTTFEAWQLAHFAADAAESVKGPEADPDADGVRNLAEYALGLDPHEPGREGFPAFTFITEGGTRYGGVRFARTPSAADVAIIVEAAGDLTDPDWQVLEPTSSTPAESREWIEVRDVVPAASQSARFYRISIRIQ